MTALLLLLLLLLSGKRTGAYSHSLIETPFHVLVCIMPGFNLGIGLAFPSLETVQLMKRIGCGRWPQHVSGSRELRAHSGRRIRSEDSRRYVFVCKNRLLLCMRVCILLIITIWGIFGCLSFNCPSLTRSSALRCRASTRHVIGRAAATLARRSRPAFALSFVTTALRGLSGPRRVCSKRTPTARFSSRPETPSVAPRHPIVLCHGLLGFVRFLGITYFRGVRDLFSELGVKHVYTPLVHPTSSIAVRATELKTQISEFQRTLAQSQRASTFDPSRVNIIAHSMGGLDSRFLISKLGGADMVASLTTLATPHHGSPYSLAFTTKAELFRIHQLMKLLRVPMDAFYDLSVERSKEFNASVLDVDSVKYYSYSAAAKFPVYSPFYLSYKLIKSVEGDNDGLVSVQSGIWGNHIRTLNADHTQLIGLPFGLSSTRFDHFALYREIVSQLVRDGL